METNTQKGQERKKPIFIAATPNVESDDLALCRSLLFSPDTWTEPFYLGDSTYLQQQVQKRFGVSEAFFFNTGRASLYALLSAFGIGKGDHVLIQAYTCLAVPLGIKWTGARPIYADVAEDSYNAGVDEIKQALTSRTRAVIVQHTFGEPADIEGISKLLAEENKRRDEDQQIFLIEDCAHALGAEYNGKQVGRGGDGAFFSFGQEKVISTTQGGMAFAREKSYQNRLKEIHRNAQNPSRSQGFRAVIHPLLWQDITQTYYVPPFTRITIGRGLIMLYRLLGLLQNQADPSKADTSKPDVRKMSAAQGKMLKNQWTKLDRLVDHRRKIASVYNALLPHRQQVIAPGHSFLRFPLQVKSPKKLESCLKDHKIIAGNWYSAPIHPPGTDLRKFHYKEGSCPNAEEVAQHSINLPTGINVSPQDAERVAKYCVTARA